MRNHIPKCRGLTEKEIQDLMLKGIEESLSAQPSVRFDPVKFRELLVLAIIRHNLPFTFVEYAGIRDLFAYVNPDIKLVCRNTAKADVVKVYHEQKSLLKNLLQHISSRISLTSDLWTSIAQDGYFCLTAHYIDSEWKLQHKILSFSIMPTPHNGVNLCEKLHNILTEWGIDKRLFSLTLDNASANDVSADLLKGQLNNRHALLCEGDFFHMRCCAHIINLIVQDGLKEMEIAICKVRESVRYVRGSQTRRQKFLDCIAQVSLQPAKGFRQDVPTRWNSTFLMLESALYYRRALVLLEMSDSNYTYCPSVEEWDRVENVNKFLRVFFEVTSIFSGTNYPTSNLYFPQVFFVQFTISNAMKGHDSYIQQMATRMNAKFEKYWSEYNPLLAIACILDPRYKLQFVEYAYKKLYGDSEGSRMIRSIRGKLFSLFENYVSPFASNVASSSGSSQQSELDSMSSSHGYSADFYNMMQSFDDYESQEFLMTRKSEIEMYLDDIKVPRNSQLDVLAYWKTNEYRYPELSKMARDIFAISISTVASESAFSIGGRILDEHRSVLKPPIVEALICTRDWLYNEKVKPEEKLEVLTEDVFSSNLNNEAQTIWDDTAAPIGNKDPLL